MRLIHKVMDFSVGQVDDEARTFWAVASTSGVDRQGDEIDPAGWDLSSFVKNPVIPWSHDYTRPPVAKALSVRVEDGRLVFLAQFPGPEEYAFADTIFKLYRGGYLRAFSVGFSPVESEIATRELGGRTVTGTKYFKQELYEISCVTLPANPEALVTPKPMNPDPGQDIAKSLPPNPSPFPARAGANRELVKALVTRLVESRLRYHLGL